MANLSLARARFAARRPERGPGGEAAVEIEPGADGVLRLEVPAGERRIELEVAGPPPGGAALWGGPFFVPARARVPVVVVLTLDTTRRDALGAFGAPADATPRLDRFARGATVYRRASSSTSWTLPAHASLFTSLHPPEHRAVRRGQRLFADLFEDILSADQYQVIKIHSSTGALSVIQAEKPDVVLLDIMMPDVSGLEVLRFMRREPGLQQIPVGIVSAKTLPADIRTGLEAGATAYLTKPVDVDTLRQAVARVIREADLGV